MKHFTKLLVLFIFSCALPMASLAEDTADVESVSEGTEDVATSAEDARGVERMGEGTVDVVTSPGKIVEGIAEKTEEQGAAGVVTGTAKGSAKAAGKAAKGAVGVGAVETVFDPLTGK